MTPPDDLPDELHVERVDNASALLRICAGPRDYATRYVRGERLDEALELLSRCWGYGLEEQLSAEVAAALSREDLR